MSARGPAVDRLLPLTGLPALDVSAAEPAGLSWPRGTGCCASRTSTWPIPS